MSSSTARADAPTMPTDRRALLRSALAVGAIAAVPTIAAAATATGHPDAALFALQPEIDAADRLYYATFEPLERAETAYYAAKPERPDRLAIMQGLTNDEFREIIRRAAAGESMDALLPAKMPSLKDGIAAADAAEDAWEQECDRVEIETGVLAAEQRLFETGKITDRIRDQIAAIRATTIDGRRFKARYLVEHDADNVSASIVNDLLAM
jgi:hypothetical protein